MQKINLSDYTNTLKFKNQIKRLIWNLVWLILIRPFPRRSFNFWNIFLLRIFGAKIDKTAVIYSSAKIYMPWNLEMQEHSCLAPEVDCYNVDKVVVGAYSTVSQKTYLCSASHDVTKSNNPLIMAPIIIKNQVWIGANVFIGMGVTINTGAVVGATASVYKDIEAWTIVGGNPAKFIKKRLIND
ncbi:MAG: putative colanic acid biosynthesis acetyltransferase [Polaribacter sp.]|jgi:putative colanic acid biosynthesis acetyltransferase WcaF|nr:putative colanic acid biosynthesis acetyltransferase [Polaribacter sp.]